MRVWARLLISSCVGSLAEASGSNRVDTCGTAECNAIGDETSMLSVKRFVNLGGRSPPEGKAVNTTLQAQLLFSTVVNLPNSSTSKRWRAAQEDLFDCQLSSCAGLQSKIDALNTIANESYKCSLTDVLAVGNSFHLSSITLYSSLYTMQNPETHEVGQLQVYATNYKPHQLVVNGTSILGFTWTPNRGNVTDISEPNTLTWKKGGGNPTSGMLKFAFTTSFLDLPENAYTGPYFYGQISDTMDTISEISSLNAMGVILQNDVVGCGAKDISPEEFLENPPASMKNGASQACLSGNYSLFVNGEKDHNIPNLIVDSDSVILGGKTVDNYVLRNSRITWNSSTANEYSGSLVFRAQSNGNEVSGTLARRDGTLYSVNGYVPALTPSPASGGRPVSLIATDQDPQPTEDPSGKQTQSWFSKQPDFLKTIEISAGLALGLTILKSIWNRELPHAIRLLIDRFRNNRDAVEEAVAEDIPDDARVADPSPEAVERWQQADQDMRNRMEQLDTIDEAGESVLSDQERVDSIDSMLDDESIPDPLRELLESQRNLAEESLQQSRVVVQQHADLLQDIDIATQDSIDQAEEVDTKDAEAQDKYQEELEDSINEEADIPDGEGGAGEEFAESGLFEAL